MNGSVAELLAGTWLSLNNSLFYVLLLLGDPAGIRLREYGYAGQAHLTSCINGGIGRMCECGVF
jgi:hypothetical protein